MSTSWFKKQIAWLVRLSCLQLSGFGQVKEGLWIEPHGYALDPITVIADGMRAYHLRALQQIGVRPQNITHHLDMAVAACNPYPTVALDRVLRLVRALIFFKGQVQNSYIELLRKFTHSYYGSDHYSLDRHRGSIKDMEINVLIQNLEELAEEKKD